MIIIDEEPIASFSKSVFDNTSLNPSCQFGYAVKIKLQMAVLLVIKIDFTHRFDGVKKPYFLGL